MVDVGTEVCARVFGDEMNEFCFGMDTSGIRKDGEVDGVHMWRHALMTIRECPRINRAAPSPRSSRTLVPSKRMNSP